jgi:hypothetical protein
MLLHVHPSLLGLQIRLNPLPANSHASFLNEFELKICDETGRGSCTRLEPCSLQNFDARASNTAGLACPAAPLPAPVVDGVAGFLVLQVASR